MFPLYGPKKRQLSSEQGDDDDDDDESAHKRARLGTAPNPIPDLVADNHLEIAKALYHLAHNNAEFYTTLISLLLSWETSRDVQFKNMARQARQLLREVSYYVDIAEAYAHAYFQHAIAAEDRLRAASERADHLAFRRFFRLRLLEVAPGWLVIYDRAEHYGLFRFTRYPEEAAWPEIGPRWRDPYGYHRALIATRDHKSKAELDIRQDLYGSASDVIDVDMLCQLAVVQQCDVDEKMKDIGRLYHKPMELIDPLRLVHLACRRSAANQMDGRPDLAQVTSSLVPLVQHCKFVDVPMISTIAFWDYIVMTVTNFDADDSISFVKKLGQFLETHMTIDWHRTTQGLVKAFFRNSSDWIATSGMFEVFVQLVSAQTPPTNTALWQHFAAWPSNEGVSRFFDVSDVLFKAVLKQGRVDLLAMLEREVKAHWGNIERGLLVRHALELYLLYLCYYPGPLEESAFFDELEHIVSDSLERPMLYGRWARYVHPFAIVVHPRMVTRPDRVRRLLDHMVRLGAKISPFEFVSKVFRYRVRKLRIPRELGDELQKIVTEETGYNHSSIIAYGMAVDDILRQESEFLLASEAEIIRDFPKALSAAHALFKSDRIGVETRQRLMPFVRRVYQILGVHLDFLLHKRPDSPILSDSNGLSPLFLDLHTFSSSMVFPSYDLSPLHAGAFLAEAELWYPLCEAGHDQYARHLSHYFSAQPHVLTLLAIVRARIPFVDQEYFIGPYYLSMLHYQLVMLEESTKPPETEIKRRRLLSRLINRVADDQPFLDAIREERVKHGLCVITNPST